MTEPGEEERPDIQKKVFGRWINAKLARGRQRVVTDLYFDLQDGEVLLDLISTLANRDIKREQGSLRVQKLRNVDNVLNVLREERVKLSEISNAAAIVDGEPASVLALCWSVILHWQFYKVLQQSSSTSFNTLEKRILKWCQDVTCLKETTSISDLSNFTRQLADGLILSHILHRFKPNLLDMDAVKAKSPRERLEFVFRTMESHYKVPRILDPEDVHTLASDKKAVMTYVMCMFEALPHDLSALEDESVVETVHLGSPLKSHAKLKSGKLLDYDTFCHLHEDVLEWLLEAEDKLKSMQSVSNNLTVAKKQFDDNAEYMAELDTHQRVVGEVIRKSRHLLSTTLTGHQEKDVRVRQKLLIDRWEGLRQQALERQNLLHEKLMHLQRSEMETLRNWMMETEDKISRMTVVGCTLEAIEKQEAEHNELEKSLENQHSTVHSISNFIYVETESSRANSSEANVNNSASSPSVVKKEAASEVDLEGQLMALGERWTVLCTWVEERAEVLRITRDELELLEHEKSRLTSWLDKREGALRDMDRNPSDNREDLLRQAQLIACILHEWSSEKKALMNVNSVAEKLVSRCLSSLPEDEGPNEAIKQDTAAIGKTVEGIQDRWDILTAILEAQKQRVARHGIEIDKMKHLSEPKEDFTNNCVSGENTPKKRRVTGTKRIEFEAAYAKVSQWLAKISEEVPTTCFAQAPSLTEIEAHMENVTRIEGEIKEWRVFTANTIALGTDLMSDIQSESDYPEEYLNNVSDKVHMIQQQVSQLETRVPETMRNLSYWKKKTQLYRNLDVLSGVLRQYEAKLKEGQATVEDMQVYQTNLATHTKSLAELKVLAKETLLHPGAVIDPSNCIKSDLYTFCEHFEVLEGKLAEHHTSLMKQSSSLPSSSVIVVLKEVSQMEEQLRSGHLDQEQSDLLRDMVQRLKDHQDRVEAIALWTQEVSAFLIAEDALFGDMENLETQVKDSDALVEDVATLKSKLEEVNCSGQWLISKCNQENEMHNRLSCELQSLNDKWDDVTSMSKAQNVRLRAALQKSKNLMESLDEIRSFMAQLQKDLPEMTPPVMKPTELSQRTFKLLHFKDKIEKKRTMLQSLLQLQESPDLLAKSAVDKISQVQQQWKRVCEPVIDSYQLMKIASTEYGEFKTLLAQESDWMERLEKKLRKPTNSAADAEEISEELNGIENFLDNHPEDRLRRIHDLAQSLTEKNILISSWQEDAQRLENRWDDLQQRAKQRIFLLETAIAEAQEWEYKLIAVQDWLAERDILLSSHLEHELTVDDLPDESQKEAMLREFEDQENLLAEMDEQVEAYRSAGKIEAAVRLEDQLHLIHERYQELTMKFELFQKQPTVEYEPRLARVARQLRDIKEKLYLTELASAEKEGIEGQLHHARCIQNALSDIKAEVGNLIKIGRRIIENETFERKMELKEKVDALEKDYHDAGCEVVQASRKLNEALGMSEKLNDLVGSLDKWLSSKLQEVSNIDSTEKSEIMVPFLKHSVQEMMEYRDSYEEIKSLNGKFFEHCNPALLTTLRESTLALDEKWAKLHDSLREILSALCKSGNDPEIIEIADNLDELRASEARKLSTMSQDETPLLDEFRTAFQEVSLWINKAETQLGTNRESQERAIGQEIDEWAPKMGDLRRMAEKLVQLFVSQRDDVEPEMASLHQRWEHITREVEKRLKSNQAFRMVEVEEIKTTISHLSIPLSEPVVTVTQPSPIVDPDEEIETLIEDEPLGKNLRFCHAEAATCPPSASTPTAATSASVDSSSESLSGETLKQQLVSKCSSSKSPPPQTLPKPKWYLEQRAQGIKMPVSPERVKVIQNMLPSPQKLVGTVESSSSYERQMPEKAVLFSTSTTPSTTIDSPASTTPSVVDDDVILAKDNAVIDHLLAETELQLEEVAKHVKSLATSKDKAVQDFEDRVKAIIDKIETASRKIDQIENEQDLPLRKDLVNMELKRLEAEVTTTLSSGNTLAVSTKRKNPPDFDNVMDQVNDLKSAWKTLQSLGEQKKSTISETEVKLRQFRKELEQLKRWLSSAKVKLVRANHDEKVAKQFIVEVKNRKTEVDHLNLLASQLQHRNALSGCEMALNFINSDWEEIVERIKTMSPKKSNNLDVSAVVSGEKLYTAPGSPLMRSAPAEVFTRMQKMMDALAAIDRQMDTQILNTERPCENLVAQSDALTTVKNALDRLRPTLKQTDQDIDKLSSANLSMEFFEKLSNSHDKLLDEWKRVRIRYAQRQELWNKSKTLEGEVQKRRESLELWLRSIGENSSLATKQVTNEDIESKGKLAAELTTYCKEFMTLTSAQEAVNIQTEVDGLLRRWRSVLAVLTSERKAAFGLCEKVEKLSLLMGKAVNASDRSALQVAISELTDAQKNLGNLRSQFCRRINDEIGMRDSAFLKARSTVERLVVTLPRRIEALREKEQRLLSLEEKRREIHGQVEGLMGQVRHAKSEKNEEKQQSTFKSVQFAIANLQYEVNRVLNEYVCLEREVVTHNLEMDASTAENMQSLKNAWLQLSIESRQLATQHNNVMDASNMLKKPTDLGSIPTTTTASLTSPQSTTYSITNESCVSPTTCSQSSFLSDESQVDFDDMAAQIEKELHQILEEATQLNLAVHDASAIRAVVDQQQKVMRQLETKRDSLDSLGTRLLNKGSGNQMVLQSRLGVLRDQLDVTKHRVLSRKSECTAMASDSEQFQRKLNEINSWLSRLDGILQSTHPIGQTLDVLEYQNQSAMDALKELSKYEHHIRLFTQVCERMCHVYGRDDTTQIEEAKNKVENRHKSLSKDFTKRRNEIQAVQNSFSSFDKSVERFFEWLFDIEMSVEQLESDTEVSPSKRSNVLSQKFEDIKNEIHDKDRVFHALNNTGNSLMEKMADEERTMLGQKLSEMSTRWKALQNKMLDINLHLRPKSDDSAGTGEDEDTSFSHLSMTHANLRDHMDWVLRKKRELSSLSLDGDVKGLRRQLEEHSGFRHQLNERGTLIRNSVNLGQKLATKYKDKPDFAACLGNLELEWQELLERSTEWHDDILRMLDNVKAYEDRTKELNKLLLKMEDDLTHIDVDLDDDLATADDVHRDLSQQAKDIVQLSHNNRRDLEDMTRRLKHIIVENAKRQKIAPDVTSDLDPVHSVDFLSSALKDGWERGEEDGIPYYINHREQRTQWDHPEFTDLMESLLEMNTVKYSVYRMALKLRKVQQKLCLDLLDLKSALVAFNSHGLTDDKHDSFIAVQQMIVVLTSVYEALHEEEPDEVVVPLCIDLCLNWLLNVFDTTRASNGQIRVLSFKIGLLVLCRGPLTEKYIQLFNLVSRDGDLTPQQLALLLFDAIQIPKYLAEVAAFGGSDIEPSVRSCFIAPSPSSSGKDSELNEKIQCKQFLQWLQKEPQSMVWLPVLHRLSAAEMATHNTKCRACKAYPIIGFRYHCLKCFNFDLCHNCFFVGRTAKGHKVDHPMQEYCTSTGRSANFKILGQAIRNSFRTKKYFKKKLGKLGYLPVGSLCDGHEFSPTISPNMSVNSRGDANSTLKITNNPSSCDDNQPIDEHSIIAEYCRMIQERCRDGEADIESSIKELESERRALMREYQDLTQKVPANELATLGDLPSIEEEAKNLRQQTVRMEARMKILLDHNHQMESQLKRLRQLVLENTNHEEVGGSGGQFGTLQSKAIVAQDLNIQSPNQQYANENRMSSRLPPPLTSSREDFLNGTTDDDDDDEGVPCKDSQSSLDLSAHDDTPDHVDSDN